YAAVAIGAGSEDVTNFLEKNYKTEISQGDAAALAIAAINLKSEQKEGIKHIKMAEVKHDAKLLQRITEADLEKFYQVAKQKFTN
ncbi:MAG: proteasome subunit alpha, partial [Thaumarchaeota archaeon]|nr:proteasome subunit alpha [Nitrososphaerota archaeon]